MSVIYKYTVGATGSKAFNLPRGAEILSAGLDPAGDLCVWARVNPGEPLERVTLYVIGTGQEVPAGARFVETVLQGPWVWHIFK